MVDIEKFKKACERFGGETKVIDDKPACVVTSLDNFTKSLFKAFHQIDEELEKREDWFRNLWESGADEYEFYKLAKDILGGKITFEEFDKGWQFRTVLNEDYEQAKLEFVNLLLGFW